MLVIKNAHDFTITQTLEEILNYYYGDLPSPTAFSQEIRLFFSFLYGLCILEIIQCCGIAEKLSHNHSKF